MSKETLQNISLASGKFEKEKKYWLNKLSGTTRFELPLDYQRLKSIVRTYKTLQYSFSSDVSAKITKLARNSEHAAYMILLVGVKYLLYLYTSSEDVVVISPIPKQKNSKKYINSILALRTLINSDMTFKELLLKIKQTVVEADQNQNYPIQKVAEELNILFSEERFPFSDVVVSLENIHDTSYMANKRHDLSFAFVKNSDGLECRLEYGENLFRDETIRQIAKQLETILQVCLVDPDKKIKYLDIISAEERQKLLNEFNQTTEDYSKDKLVYQLFEEQVYKNPDRVALIFEDKQMTYLELNEKANQLARVLRNKGVKSDQIVGLMVEPSFEMFIGILGIIKAGGAYLPIDPDYPQERIDFILKDSEVDILITQNKLYSYISFDGEIIDLDDENNYQGERGNLEIVNKKQDLIYIIYTSGSTGKPKGVMVEHRNVLAYINAFKKEFNPDHTDVVLQQASYAFDASIEEIFPILTEGGKLVISKRDQIRDINILIDVLEKNKATIISCSPLLLNELNKMHPIESIHTYISGGDVLKAEYIFNLQKHAKVYNTYGPTETTVCVTYNKCKDSEMVNVPIGKPIANYKVYILDRNQQLVPVGVAGELCVAGDGVTRGYLNRPELTAEKFIPNMFLKNSNVLRDKIYRTGDKARWLPDGNVEFLGRIDNQVKIRGFRIELGEIENQLLNHDKIAEAVVIDRIEPNGDKYLCAYLVLVGEVNSLSVAEIRTYLEKELPDYMIPSFFIQLDKIPLTTNGKVDRNALLKVDGNFSTGIEYVAPSTKTEEKITKIWTEVLGVERVGINDNFFILGGQSFKAMLISSKIIKEFNVEIPVRIIFENPTVKELAIYIDQADEASYSSIEVIEPRDYYPVSSAQKRIYVLNQLDTDNITYNMPYVLTLDDHLDKERVKLTLRKLIQRHEVLRTSFKMIDDQIAQIIHQEEIDLDITYLQASEENLLETFKDFIQPFDLSKAPLLRAGFIECDAKDIFILDMHHIISDGFSMEILTNEFMNLYNGAVLPELKIQYKDFAVWQNEFLKSEQMKIQEDYWLDKFSGELPVLNLPTDYPRPSVQDFEGTHFTFDIDKELTFSLNELSLTKGVTLNMTLLAAYYILLAKYSGQEDIIIGTPNAGRHRSDLENIIGMFVNTLVLRGIASSEKTFAQLLNEVKDDTLRAYENQDYQFEMLVEKLHLERDMSRNPLFDVLFILQNISDEKMEKSSTVNFELNISKFDLTLMAIELKDGMQFTFEYRSKLFKPQTIERLAKHYINILNAFSQNSDILISNIDLLSNEERNMILDEFNSAEIKCSQKTIHQLFEEEVEKTPEKIALVCNNDHMTYEELNKKSNQLANLLRSKGIAKDQIVGIMVERSLEMIVGMMGVLKAGGAYLPIDFDYPKERTEYMLKDSNVNILLTQDNMSKKVNFAGEIILLGDETLFTGDSLNFKNMSSPNDLAYLIYTSGSTGMPKGVLLEHKGIVSLATYFKKDLGIKNTDRILQFASCSFDASVWEIYMTLLTGATLYLIDQDTINSYDDFIEFLNTNDLTVATLPPVYLKNLDPEKITSLRKVVTAGSKTNFDLVDKWKNKVSYVNAYGPTEGTICATDWECVCDTKEFVSVPIGKPIHNTKVYILNRDGQPAPIGVPGELCISGIGLARGYLNRQKLTEEKFVLNPFSVSGNEDEKMYRTGDLARWLLDGNIEFLGRIDHQVKIRGYRIEIGEIESWLKKHERIIEALVVDYKDFALESYLCAYYTSKETLADNDLRQYLSNKLPNYMIPTYLISLDEMPITTSGKIDRKALPRPEGKLQEKIEYIPPSNEIEEKLVKIFSEVLSIKKIGVAHNFFEIGGDSIKAMQVAAKISQRGYYCKVQDIIMYPTIAQLAPKVEKRDDQLKEEQGLISGEVLPSAIQLRTFDLDTYDKQHHHSCPFFLELKQDINIDMLKKALAKLLEHHDALRLNYDPKKEVFFENNSYLEQDFEIPVYDLSNFLAIKQNKQIAEYGTEIMSSINLEHDVYFKACIFDLGKRGKRLLLVVHHHVLDPASGIILLEDLTNFLTQLTETGEIKTSMKTASFKTWTSEVNKYAQSNELLTEKAYWEEVLTTDFSMPQDFDKGPYYYNSCERVIVGLNEDETEKLLTIANRTYKTETSQLLITAMALALSNFANEKEVVFELENNGRQGLNTDIDIFRTIGWFTAIYPVKFDFRNCVDLREEILYVKSRLRQTPNKGVGYGILKEISKTDLPEMKFKDTVIFNYIGQVDNSLNNEFFKGATEYAGEITHPESSLIGNLGVGCSINSGKFKIWFAYSKNKYRKKTIQKLAKDYLNILRKIIDHCISLQ
ncbi:MAG: amino acid adenylation domain-containing protein [Halanaerobiales bacterium]|nr:amino acid adenylation domain-containing protein [Halanaerobiales bacterium]